MRIKSFCFVICVASCLPHVSSSAEKSLAHKEHFVWDFEAGPLGWKPRMKSIQVNRAIGLGATQGSRACLHIRGRIEGGWNYAISDHRPLQGGAFYRLSAWVRVTRLGPRTEPPFLKCEFLDANKRSLGRANTERYDPKKLGQWQRLVGEFRAPKTARTCWLALEKGGRTPMEIDAYLDDVTLERIERLSALERFRLKPLPAPLLKMKGVHPRLYLTSERVHALRKAIRTTHAALWRETLAYAEGAAKRKPPAYRKDDGWSGAEQLWQRGVGNTMPYLALAYALTGEKRYLASAQAWALASCGYPTWGLGHIDGMDLATGHQLFGLALVYDWCYADLDSAARRTIRETIVRRASAQFEAAATGRAGWRRSYLQNHLWVDACGLAAAGLAVYDEHEDAALWIGFALDKFQRTMESLGPDGASHEGVGYWQYGVEYMLKFMCLARDLLSVNLFDNEWWKHTARYYIYLTLPRGSWTRRNSIVDIADCPRYNWYGPDYLLRELAREYRDPYAQWFAQQVDEADIDAPSARWLNVLWYDPTVKPKPPTDLPTLHHFEDMGIVSARSDWSGRESLVVFKSGPFIGHHGVATFSYDPGGGHVHPDANHFVLFGAGEWLIRDDGYCAKHTAQHNTLLVDSRGQLGEGSQWFRGSEAFEARPQILRAESSPALDQIVGDAASAYPVEVGLRRFVRVLLFVKPNALIVLDDIETDRERDLDLRFHPESSETEREGAAYIIKGKRAMLRLKLLTPQGVDVHAGEETVAGSHGRKKTMFTIALRRRARHWRNAAVLTWASGESPPVVHLTAKRDTWTFRLLERVVTWNWSTMRAGVQ